MSILFAKSATPSQKVGISVVLCVTLLSTFGIFNRTLVDEQVMRAAVIAAPFLTLLCLPLVVRPVLRNPSLGFSKSRWKRWRMILGFAFIVWLFIHNAIARGLPIFCHYLVSSPGEITVTVTAKASEYKTKGCSSGRVTLTEFGSIWNSDLCGLQQAHWQRLKPGDKLLLQGQKSIFGFSVKRYGLIGRDNP